MIPVLCLFPSRNSTASTRHRRCFFSPSWLIHLKRGNGFIDDVECILRDGQSGIIAPGGRVGRSCTKQLKVHRSGAGRCFELWLKCFSVSNQYQWITVQRLSFYAIRSSVACRWAGCKAGAQGTPGAARDAIGKYLRALRNLCGHYDPACFSPTYLQK